MVMSALKDHLTDAEVTRVEKLPAWAISLMETLAITANFRQKSLDEARSKIASMAVDGDEETTTWVDPFSERPVSAGVNPDVRHRLADGDEVTVTFGSKGVAVAQSGPRSIALLVQPVTANEIRIVTARPLSITEEV